ncbi:MAG: hypothetical protein J0L81_06815 [Caulobacterales bacterium]|jgi:hypothetical protein|nr:hypothetical protein [Caulobacterales bacterium]
MSIYDEATVREWAYDPDRPMIDDADQDEDLTIGLLPLAILLPLVDDPQCPKGGYILQCLDYHHANLIRRGADYDVAETRTAAVEAAQYKHDALQEWARRLERLLAFRDGIGPVDIQQALVIGREVLLDMSRQFFDDVEVKEQSQTSFVVELAGATSTYWERLHIDKATGRFLFSRSGF